MAEFRQYILDELAPDTERTLEDVASKAPSLAGSRLQTPLTLSRAPSQSAAVGGPVVPNPFVNVKFQTTAGAGAASAAAGSRHVAALNASLTALEQDKRGAGTDIDNQSL